MSKTLFQITDEMDNLMNYGCDAEGEIPQTQEEFNLMYDSIQMEFTTKVDNTNCIAKIKDSNIELANKEIKRLQAYVKREEQQKDWLTSRVDFVLKKQFTNEDGVLDVDGLKEAVKNLNKKLNHSAISYRKSETTEVTNFDLLPTDMKTVKVEEVANKTKIKEYLESIDATECDFARINKKLNISIK